MVTLILKQPGLSGPASPIDLGTYGQGSPEGRENAAPGQQYFDKLNGILYEKQNGYGNTGWIQIGGGGAGDISSPYTSDTVLQIYDDDGWKFVDIVPDENGVISTATVKWRDGTSGVFTPLVINDDLQTVDSFSITYPASGLTVIQPTMTRDVNGFLTHIPDAIVA